MSAKSDRLPPARPCWSGTEHRQWAKDVFTADLVVQGVEAIAGFVANTFDWSTGRPDLRRPRLRASSTARSTAISAAIGFADVSIESGIQNLALLPKNAAEGAATIAVGAIAPACERRRRADNDLGYTLLSWHAVLRTLDLVRGSDARRQKTYFA